MPEIIAKLNGKKKYIAASVPLLGFALLLFKLIFAVGELNAQLLENTKRLDRIEVRVDQIMDGLHGRR